MPPALEVSTHLNQQTLFGITDINSSRGSSADELCDELMLHTFGCDTCIDGSEESCDIFRSLRNRITEAGGPTESALLAL
jgi:hypothetical protein